MNKLSTTLTSVFLLTAMSAVNADVKPFGSIERILEYNDSTGATDMIDTGSNYIGFKANEDLGNGLSAEYKAFWRMSSEDSAGSVTMWDNYVGLKGNFGSVKFGRFNSLTKQASEDYLNRLERGHTYALSPNHQRNSNAIQYRSPSMNGLNFGLEVSANGSTGKTGVDIAEYSVEYKNGKIIKAVAAYRDNKATNDQSYILAVKAAVTGNVDGYVAYEELDNNDNTPVVDSTTVIADWKVTPNNNLRLSYKDRSEGSDQTALEVQHYFSKKTSVFATYTNDSYADSTLDTDKFGIGMRMKF